MPGSGMPKGKRCGCRDEDGRLLGARCQDLRKRHHGKYVAEIRIDTSQGRRKLHRSGFDTATDRDEFASKVAELLRLAGDDKGTRARIGDLIFERTRFGGELPASADVRRRLALGTDPGGSGETFGQAWEAWLAGKKRLRASSAKRLRELGEHWILPVLRDILLERLNGGHCALVFDRVDDINDEIAAARAEGRPPVLADDVRQRPRVIGIASQHRVHAALRAFCNHAWRQRHVLLHNPVYVVELPPEETPEAKRWTAAEAMRFLAASAADPLALMLRVVVLRGARRGEAVGFRWAGADLDAGYLTVDRPVLQLGGKIIEGRPKSTAGEVRGERRVWLDAETVALLRAHRREQVTERLRASTAWQDNDLVFARADGSPWPPDFVTRRFKELAAAAGVPVIKLHEGRHTAASLARDAGVDAKIRQEQLGHTTGAMTDHYTHVLAAAHLAAAEAVARLAREAGA